MSLERLRNFLWPVFVPLACLWAAVTWARRRLARWRRPSASAIPVVCFGNVHDGGTGKTPLVLACVRRFADRHPVVVSRGYGGTTKGVAPVDASVPDAAKYFGDEPVELASRGATVIVGRDRAAAISHAASRDAGWAVLDDGYQRLGVKKDFAIVVISADRSPWSAWCWPAGPLREPLSAIREADAVLLTAWPDETSGLEAWESVLERVDPKVPRYRAVGRLDGWRDPIKGTQVAIEAPVAALCAIGSPERFFRRVRESVAVAHERSFRDHHRFLPAELEAFSRRAEETGAQAVVTTYKDWARLRGLTRHIALPIRVLEIGYEVPETLWQDLEGRLASKR